MNQYKQSTQRVEFVRQRRSTREQRSTKEDRRPSAVSGLASLFNTEKPAPRSRQVRSRPAASAGQYEFTFTGARTRVRAPAITLPQFNMRWVSAFFTALLVIALYAVWNSPLFAVNAAEVTGNHRLASEEIFQALDLTGQPVFKAIPSVLETNLRSTFPDLESVQVHVVFPNHILVDVTERIPVLDWYENETDHFLVDINGIRFPPRLGSEGLIVVHANGTPMQAPLAEGENPYEHAYIPPEVVRAMITLFPSIPAGMPVIYDPQYGMGWQDDAHNWRVFLGTTTQDVETKLVVYQSILDAVTRQGRTPELISIAYLDSPFIK